LRGQAAAWVNLGKFDRQANGTASKGLCSGKGGIGFCAHAFRKHIFQIAASISFDDDDSARR
jgi:hypothetical protein